MPSGSEARFCGSDDDDDNRELDDLFKDNDDIENFQKEIETTLDDWNAHEGSELLTPSGESGKVLD